MRCSDARGPVTLSSATCLAQARAKAACQAASVDSVAYETRGARRLILRCVLLSASTPKG